MIVNFYCS